MRSIQTIVFDWNGTLFDDAAIACQCFSGLVEKLGFPRIPLNTFQEKYDVPLDRFYYAIGLTDADIGYFGPRKMGDFHDHYERLADQTPLREGAATLLERNHRNGLTQLILSNHLVEPIRRQLERFHVADFIKSILAYPDREHQFVGGPKGDRLRRVIDEHKLDPSTMMIVGDSPEEMNIGRSLGLVSVAIAGGYVAESRLIQAKPDHMIASLTELEVLLAGRP